LNKNNDFAADFGSRRVAGVAIFFLWGKNVLFIQILPTS
jgi:hypothetical protein